MTPALRTPNNAKDAGGGGGGGGGGADAKTPSHNPSGAAQTPQKGEVPPTPTATFNMAVVQDDVKRCSNTGLAEIWCSCSRCEKIYPDERHWARGVIDRKGRTPLHNACIWGEEERVMTLLRAAAKDESISFRQKTVDKEGATVVHLGAPFPAVLEMLFAMHSFDPEFVCLAERKYGYTALHRAAQAGSTKSVAILVDRGIAPQVLDNKGRTPMHLAARSGHAECVQFLMELGASPTAEDGEGRSSIEYARGFGKEATAKLMEDHLTSLKLKALREIGASQQQRGGGAAARQVSGRSVPTPQLQTKRRVAGKDSVAHAAVMATKDIVPDAHTLQIICTEGKHGEVEVLLQKAKVKDVDIMLTHDRDLHRIALHFAAHAGHDDVIRNLLKHQPYGGEMGGGHSCEEIAKKQLQHHDISGNTALHLAIQAGRERTALMLIENGAPMHIATHRGEVALHYMGRYAGGWEKPSIQRFIRAHVEAGLDLNHRDSVGKTAINYAAEANSVKIVAFLMDFGAALHSVDNGDGDDNAGGEGGGGRSSGAMDTPGHASARSDFAELTRFLLELDVRVFHVVNEQGWTPLHEAALHGCLKAATAILDAGLHPDMRPITAAPPSEGLHPNFLASPPGRHMALELTGVVRPGGASGQPSPRARPGQGFRRATRIVKPTPGLVLPTLPDAARETLMAERYMMTPLMCAVVGNHLEIAKLLLMRGADPTARDYKGRGLLHHAACHADYQPPHATGGTGGEDRGGLPCPTTTATFLLETNLATPQSRDKGGRSPLHYCARKGATELSRLLVHHCANVNAYDAAGRAPVHEAARSGAAAVVEALAEGPLDVHALTRDGGLEDAMKIAVRHNRPLVVSVLHKAHKASLSMSSNASSGDRTTLDDLDSHGHRRGQGAWGVMEEGELLGSLGGEGSAMSVPEIDEGHS